MKNFGNFRNFRNFGNFARQIKRAESFRILKSKSGSQMDVPISAHKKRSGGHPSPLISRAHMNPETLAAPKAQPTRTATTTHIYAQHLPKWTAEHKTNTPTRTPMVPQVAGAAETDMATPTRTATTISRLQILTPHKACTRGSTTTRSAPSMKAWLTQAPAYSKAGMTDWTQAR